MGATCCGGNKSNPRGETNLQTYKGKRGETTDLNSLPIFTVIKAQALMRGFLARRRVKKLYGFEMRTGLMAGTSGKSLNQEELAVQRQRVVLIREKLPTFEYGLYKDEDFEPEFELEQRPMLILQDGAQYEG